MLTTVSRSRYRKIAVAFLLLTLASWSHEGLVICYGADGHIGIERPSDKDCCDRSENTNPTTFSEPPGIDHCIDVSIGAEKYLASAGIAAPVQHCRMAPSICSTAPIPGRITHRSVLWSPQLAALHTIVLII